MKSASVFTQTDADLLPVLQELVSREPIFHTEEFGMTRADGERGTAPEFWEVGASGRRYSREFVLSVVESRPAVSAAAMGWEVSDEALRRLGPETFLMTYTLRQGERLTRRATVWRRAEEGWQVLYH